jgi:hypothetical protein
MATQIIYGLGGYDPTKPNNNIVDIEEVPDAVEVAIDPAKESAMQKLAILGLTDEEIRALLK